MKLCEFQLFYLEGIFFLLKICHLKKFIITLHCFWITFVSMFGKVLTNSNYSWKLKRILLLLFYICTAYSKFKFSHLKALQVGFVESYLVNNIVLFSIYVCDKFALFLSKCNFNFLPFLWVNVFIFIKLMCIIDY